MAPFIFVPPFHIIIEDSKLLTFMGNETGIGGEWGSGEKVRGSGKHCELSIHIVTVHVTCCICSVADIVNSPW
jgi:hypothetical protein